MLWISPAFGGYPTSTFTGTVILLLGFSIAAAAGHALCGIIRHGIPMIMCFACWVVSGRADWDTEHFFRRLKNCLLWLLIAHASINYASSNTFNRQQDGEEKVRLLTEAKNSAGA